MAYWEIYVLLKYFVIQANPTMKYAQHIFKGEIIILENILKHQGVKEHLPKCFQMPMHDCKFFPVRYIDSGFPRRLSGKESGCQAGDMGSIPELGGSPGGGINNPLQYSCLENLMGRGAWQAAIHRVKRVRHYFATKQQHIQTVRTELHLETRQWVFSDKFLS